MKTNYGFLLLLFTISTKAYPLSDGENKDFENSEITIKQVHLKPNQTLEVLLEIQSKTSEQDKDGDKIGSVAGQIINEFYEQKKLTHIPGESEQAGTKVKYVVQKKPVTVFANTGNEDDEAEAPVKIQIQNLAQIGSDTDVDIYEEVQRPARPIPDPFYIPGNTKTAVEEHALIEPAKSNAEIISNIVSNVNVDKPRGYNKTVVYQEPFQYQPVQSQQNENNFDNQIGSNFGSQQQPQVASFSNIASANTNANFPINLDGQTHQVVPISNIISLPSSEVTQPSTTAGPVVPTAAATDDDEDDDEDEDEDNASRVARTK